MTELHEADAAEEAEAGPRLDVLAARHNANFGRFPTQHPNPCMATTHAFCDFVERCIRDGVQVTKEVVSREFSLPEAAWNW
jgi:hypothetical protein